MALSGESPVQSGDRSSARPRRDLPEDIVVPDFEIPAHWPRAFGMDVVWNRTAVVWGAINRDTDVLYLYSEHYCGEAEPSVHAAAIKARGAWIQGAIDPASRGRSQVGQRAFAESGQDDRRIRRSLPPAGQDDAGGCQNGNRGDNIDAGCGV